MNITESAGLLLCEGVANVTGPSRIALMDPGCTRLLPFLLMSEMVPLVISLDEKLPLELVCPGVAVYPDFDSACENGKPAVCLFSDLDAASNSKIWEHAGATEVLFILAVDVSVERVQQAREEAAIWGWGQHPRQGTASHRGDALFAIGFRILGFSRAGVDSLQHDQRARISRLELISGFIREGDRVLLVAKDSVQPARVLDALTRAACIEMAGPEVVLEQAFREVDSDFVLWEEDFRPEDDSLLAAMCARLAKAGRLAVVTGNHCSVAPGDLVASLLKLDMRIERIWRQYPHADGTAFARVEHITGLEGAPDDEAANLVFLCVRTTESVRSEEEDSTRSSSSPWAPNIIAFDRDYDDPAIVRLIVAIGLRVESAGVRRALAREYVETAASNSADMGAAICALCYDWLSEPSLAMAEDLLHRGRQYISLAPANPTVLRWQVSLAFAMALICKRLGWREEAASFHRIVASQDVLRFSPLLGTKTVASLLALGWNAYADDDLSRARVYWRKSLLEARRLVAFDDWSEVIGSLDAPETFGMPELSAVLDEAGRAAAALRVSSVAPAARGKVWQAANQSLHVRLRRAENALSGNIAWIDHLQVSKDWLANQCESLERAHAADQQALAEQKAESDALREGKDWLAEQREALSHANQRAEAALLDHQAAYAALQEANEWLVGQHRCLSDQLKNAQSDFVKLKADVSELEAGKKWLEDQYSTLLQRSGRAEECLSALEVQHAGAVSALRLAHADHAKQLLETRASVEAEFRRQNDLKMKRIQDLVASHLSTQPRLDAAYEDLLSALGDAWQDLSPETGLTNIPRATGIDSWCELKASSHHLLELNREQWQAVDRSLQRIEKRLALTDAMYENKGLHSRLERIAHSLDASFLLRAFGGIHAWFSRQSRSRNGR